MPAGADVDVVCPGLWSPSHPTRASPLSTRHPVPRWGRPEPAPSVATSQRGPSGRRHGHGASCTRSSVAALPAPVPPRRPPPSRPKMDTSCTGARPAVASSLAPCAPPCNGSPSSPRLLPPPGWACRGCRQADKDGSFYPRAPPPPNCPDWALRGCGDHQLPPRPRACCPPSRGAGRAAAVTPIAPSAARNLPVK